MSGKRPALGRGLGSLLPSRPPPAPSPAVAPSAAPTPTPAPGPRQVAIERVHPHPGQPRRRFDEATLAGLADSIRAHGIIQPIVVTPLSGRTGEYGIVAGERRWRAAQKAGLHDVPVIVRDTPEHERFELALVENVQRHDLDPVEEARAYQQLVDLRGYTQEALAERVGKDRSTIANAMRLLRLPEAVLELLTEAKLGMGHARALLGLPDERSMTELARQAARTSMSVRAVEREVRRRTRPSAVVAPEDEGRRRKIIVDELETRLRRRMGVRAKLRPEPQKQGAGTLLLPYASLDELDRILAVIFGDRGGDD